MERRNIESRLIFLGQARNVEIRGEGLRVQDVFCHFWFLAEECGEVVSD